jgi:hypothetical protein
MVAQFLLPETVSRQDGKGPELNLGHSASSLLLTLGINRIIEQESLDVTVWGSEDGSEWRQIAAFPQKFYCGTYSLFLDLEGRGLKHLRAHWRMSRWGRGDLTPLFGFYLFAEEVKAMAVAH